MKLEECIRSVERYLHKDDTQPRFVNLHNVVHMNQFQQHFRVGNNIFKQVCDYAKADENPMIDSLLDDLKTQDGILFLTGFTTHLMLMGEAELRRVLSHLMQSSSAVCKIVVVCYQCEKYLNEADVRLKRLIYDVDGEKTDKPQLVFLSPQMPVPFGKAEVIGIENVSSVIEERETDIIYVRTKKRKNSYIASIYQISEQKSSYSVLCMLDPNTSILLEDYGIDELWGYALKNMRKYNAWVYYISHVFGNYKNLELVASNWKFFDAKKRWLYFIALKLYGSSNNWFLNTAAQEANSVGDLVRRVFRCLLKKNREEKDFWEYYDEWKAMRKAFDNPIEEVLDYCSVVKSKEKNMLYYLTDTTEIERKRIMEALDIYGEEYSYEELTDILKYTYPNLYAYLLPFHFKNELLDNYFHQYKYQKVINKVFPEFIALVEEQAIKRDYNLILPSRSEKIEAIEKEGTYLYFMDAMGVEFLGFIMEKCHEKGMQAYVTVCKCELPSITSFNKEFIDIFEKGGAVLIPDHNGIKDLDDIKHHGERDYDFTINKLPYHLIRELEIIEEMLDRIKMNFIKKECRHVVMIADHGSSRLSVLNGQENELEMESKGEHSGRCCPKNEIDKQPDCSTEENGFWVLASYDRFKGGRAANVEVHGGASLEEVVVPIIEITYSDEALEIYIKDNSKEIIFNPIKKNAKIEIFSKTKLSNVMVSINNKNYDAETFDDQNFVVRLPELKKEGKYLVDMYSNNNKVASKMIFHAKKQGMQVNKLL